MSLSESQRESLSFSVLAAKESQSEYEASQSKEHSLEESIRASESASLFTSESLLVEQSESMS